MSSPWLSMHAAEDHRRGLLDAGTRSRTVRDARPARGGPGRLDARAAVGWWLVDAGLRLALRSGPQQRAAIVPD